MRFKPVGQTAVTAGSLIALILVLYQGARTVKYRFER